MKSGPSTYFHTDSDSYEQLLSTSFQVADQSFLNSAPQNN